MLESTITDKGQTTVPKKVRSALGLKPRQRLQWDVTGDGTAVVHPESSALSLYRSLKPRKSFRGIKAEKASVRKRVSASVARKAGVGRP